MPRLCCGCFSRRKRKSFPIHEKQRETEVNKVFIRHIEAIRVTPPPPPLNKKTISKATIKTKSDDTKLNSQTYKQTIKENNSRISVSKLFHKSIPLKTPSPLLSEERQDKTVINTSSSWSSSTTSDLQKYKKKSKHRSCTDSYDVSKENSLQKNNISQAKKRSNDIKSPGKSKLVLENVRKMIKDQNIQQQHFNKTQQKESARL